ncbi:MAG: hypothetical protein ACM32E_27280 [Gemmatimonadota bacterium]
MTERTATPLPLIGRDGLVADDFPSRAEAYTQAFDTYAPLLRKLGMRDKLLRIRRSGAHSWAVYLVDRP